MALNKVYKSIAQLVEDTAVQTMQEVADEMRNQFEIDEDDFTKFIEDYKAKLMQKLKYQSKAGAKPSKKESTPKEKRAPSEYNLFVKNALIRMKKENPETPAKELMAKAAAEWKASKAQ
jgi:hypothetical protein